MRIGGEQTLRSRSDGRGIEQHVWWRLRHLQHTWTWGSWAVCGGRGRLPTQYLSHLVVVSRVLCSHRPVRDVLRVRQSSRVWTVSRDAVGPFVPERRRASGKGLHRHSSRHTARARAALAPPCVASLSVSVSLLFALLRDGRSVLCINISRSRHLAATWSLTPTLCR